ncbi:PRTRC system protein B [Granulicella sp. L60]|uniref:PRTRC system protein B n=1 Tax=Granulicella sp. L60 TaxID=1641866 RepID=UPI00131BE991|nr:PRTRC system protein B [Granulicella sp. L60]
MIYRSKHDPYSSRETSFVTHHAIHQAPGKGSPVLGPATPLTVEFVQSLVKGLGEHVEVEYLPANVIARTGEVIAWWTEPQKRVMHFGDTQGGMTGISGKSFPQPALLWMASEGALEVRALKESRRPDADSKVSVAPYWNTYADGSVCLGSMRAPGASTVASIDKWEQGFFDSAFTHGNVGRVTRYESGFEGLWKSLVGKDEFPIEMLIDLPETVEEFLSGTR